MSGYQLALLGRSEPSFDPSFRGLRRLRLDAEGAWVDTLPGWVQGHDALFEAIRATADWKAERRVMYEREVDVPRLVARFDPAAGPPLLLELSRALSARYEQPLDRISMNLYRDGRDSVAWHRDRVLRELPEAVVAIVSLGEPRKFLIRPLGGGRSLVFTLGWGDLLVMGGTAQRTWEHGVPKQRHAGPRLSVMFRHGTYATDDD